MMNLVKISEAELNVDLARISSSRNECASRLSSKESSSGLSSIAARTPCSSDGDKAPFARDGIDEYFGIVSLLVIVDIGVAVPVTLGCAKRRN